MRTFTLVNKTSLSIEGIQDLINESVLAYMPETDEDYANGINVAEGMCHVEFEVVKVDEQYGSEFDGNIDVFHVSEYTICYNRLFNGTDELVITQNFDIYTYLSDWSNDFLCEFYSSWGLSGLTALEIATETDTDVYIWVQYFYYDNDLGAPYDSLLRDEGDVLRFDTYQEAEEWIDNLESEPTYLSNGEYSAPSYLIVNAK